MSVSMRWPIQSRHSSSRQEIVGVVLAGGRGTRLRPLTKYTNKHLLPIGQKPLILHTVGQLINAQVRNIIVIIDDVYASDFMRNLQDGKHLGAESISYIWQPRSGPGLPFAISQLAPHVKANKIVVACGDVLVENGIKKPIEEFLDQHSGARLTAVQVPDVAGYSPLEFDGKNVSRIGSKDKSNHTAGTIDLGIYMYHRDVFDRASAIIAGSKGETEVSDINMQYAREKNLACTVIHGWWSDTGGSIDEYLKADLYYTKIKQI